MRKLAPVDRRPDARYMHLGIKRPKISWTSRRIRLGVAHHGAPSAWTAPTKDTAPAPVDRKQQNKKRR